MRPNISLLSQLATYAESNESWIPIYFTEVNGALEEAENSDDTEIVRWEQYIVSSEQYLYWEKGSQRIFLGENGIDLDSDTGIGSWNDLKGEILACAKEYGVDSVHPLLRQIYGIH